MKSASGTIRAGVCGFVTTVRADAQEDYSVRLVLESDCEKVAAFGDEVRALGAMDALQEIMRGHDGVLLSTAAKHCKGCCAACVAPDGVFKAMQVAAGLALPAESRIELSVST